MIILTFIIHDLKLEVKRTYVRFRMLCFCHSNYVRNHLEPELFSPKKETN